MVVVDLRDRAIGGRVAERRLEAHGLVCNAVGLPARDGDVGRAGLHMGTTAMTIRGLAESGFRRVARLIADLLTPDEASPDERMSRTEVAALAAQCPIPAGCLE